MCPFEGCGWSFEQPTPEDLVDQKIVLRVFQPMSILEILDQITDDHIRKHLDEAHTGWTLEGLRQMVAGQRLKRLFGIGPSEMFA